MNERIHDEPSEFQIVEGAVSQEGPNGVSVLLTAGAAAETSRRMSVAASAAAAQRPAARPRASENGEGALFECDQQALFALEGPDEDGCVWLIAGEGDAALAVNLGPRGPVAARLADWLDSPASGPG